jgi:hypothetical protein
MQMLPSGRIARHGYTLNFGWQNGTCSGSGALPFEQSNELLARAIADTTAAFAHADKELEDARTAHRAAVAALPHSAPRYEGDAGAYTPTQETKYLFNVLSGAKRRSEGMRAFVRLQTPRCAAWKPAALRPVVQVETAKREKHTARKQLTELRRAREAASSKLSKLQDRWTDAYLAAADLECGGRANRPNWTGDRQGVMGWYYGTTAAGLAKWIASFRKDAPLGMARRLCALVDELEAAGKELATASAALKAGKEGR